MTTAGRQIESADELLALMRERPTARSVADVYTYRDDGSYDHVRAVFDRDGPGAPGSADLAEIVPGSAADALCDAVLKADMGRDPEAWALLPLRYKVVGSAYLLPEHPEAPQQPGGLAQAHRALDALAADIAARAAKPALWRRLLWPGKG